MERLKTSCNLHVWIKKREFSALTGRLVSKIALRHTQITRAINAIARTGMRPGNHGNGSHARSGATRLHTYRADKPFFQLRGHIPRLPQLIIVLLDLQKIGENCSFRNEFLALCTVGARVNSAVVRVNEHLKLMRIKSTL